MVRTFKQFGVWTWGYGNVLQSLSAVPLHVVLLFKVPEITGNDIIVSHIWVGKSDAIQHTPIRDLRWTKGYFHAWKSMLWSSVY